MPLGDLLKTSQKFPSLGICGIFIGFSLFLVSPFLHAEIDPTPTEEELLQIPDSPLPTETSEGSDPTAIIPTLPDKVTINTERGMEYLRDEGIVKLYQAQIRGDNGIQMFADEVTWNEKEKLFLLEGNVAIYQGRILHRGEEATYYYEEERLGASKLRTSLDPVILEAGQFRSVKRDDGRQIFIGENAGITTNDEEDPTYWIRADRTTVIPGERVIFKNMSVFAGDRKVFWLPYLSQSLNAELGYRAIPGSQSTLGPFLKNRYGIMLGGERDPETGENSSAWLLSQWHADLMTRRGLGVGVDLFDTRLDDNPNLGWLKLYYLNDLNPSIRKSGRPRGNVGEDRFRAQLRHRVETDWFDEGRTYLDADLTWLSDFEFLQDFDSSVFQQEATPDNVVALTHQRNDTIFTLWTRLRLNDFYQSDTRLPELAIDQVQGPLFNTPILHEGQTVFGIYNEYLPRTVRTRLRGEADALMMTSPGDARITEIQNLLADRGFNRFHTSHEFSLPLKATEWLSVVPHAGIGYTNYSSVQGTGSSENRTHLSAAIDASIKLSRTYPDIVNHKWGIDSLRHIIQPYVTASWLATDELDSSFTRLDRLTASTRPRPISIGRFTAIDDLEDWSIFRLGVRNTLLTKRDGSTHQWLTLNTYLDWFFEDPEFDRKVSNLYNDLQWSPVPWLDLILETQIPIVNSDGKFTEIAASARYMPHEDLQLTLRQRFLRTHPILQDSNRFDLDAYYRFNENWGAGFTHTWEFEDSTLEYQQYSIHRSLNSWAITAGLFQRDNRVRTETGFVFGLTLRDIPDISLPLKVDSQ